MIILSISEYHIDDAIKCGIIIIKLQIKKGYNSHAYLSKS
jgi:hypothetical protein